MKHDFILTMTIFSLIPQINLRAFYCTIVKTYQMILIGKYLRETGRDFCWKPQLHYKFKNENYDGEHYDVRSMT